MQNNYTSKGKHLTESERLLIERWHNKERLQATNTASPNVIDVNLRVI